MPDEHERKLDRLAKRLRREPMTAKQIAEFMGCCLPTAHERVRSLKARGEKLYRKKLKRAKRGPRPVAYGIR